jgi:hypothetical protein
VDWAGPNIPRHLRGIDGLYDAVTGGRSWARLPSNRHVGGRGVAASLVGLGAGAVLLPPPSAESLAAQAASENAKRAEESSRTASPSPSVTPSPTPSPTNTGEPLDPDRVTELAKGVNYTAPKSQPAFATKALDLLALLPVKDTASTAGYSARAMYGQAWADIDRNGCDTRNDILKRDLTKVVFVDNSTCKVNSGILAPDPYTAKTINFLRGPETSSAVQIDHGARDAWIRAQQLTSEQRMASPTIPEPPGNRRPNHAVRVKATQLCR